MPMVGSPGVFQGEGVLGFVPEVVVVVEPGGVGGHAEGTIRRVKGQYAHIPQAVLLVVLIVIEEGVGDGAAVGLGVGVGVGVAEGETVDVGARVGWPAF